MKHRNNNFIINLFLPLQVYVILFCIGLNLINFDSKANAFKSIKSKNNTYCFNIQHDHHQNIPIDDTSEKTEIPSVNLEEEDDLFTAQFYPEVFCFVVLPNHLNKVINEEKFIEHFHPELTVPPPKINSFESFC